MMTIDNKIELIIAYPYMYYLTVPSISLWLFHHRSPYLMKLYS
jgi:hypothetical protein